MSIRQKKDPIRMGWAFTTAIAATHFASRDGDFLQTIRRKNGAIAAKAAVIGTAISFPVAAMTNKETANTASYSHKLMSMFASTTKKGPRKGSATIPRSSIGNDGRIVQASSIVYLTGVDPLSATFLIYIQCFKSTYRSLLHIWHQMGIGV